MPIARRRPQDGGMNRRLSLIAAFAAIALMLVAVAVLRYDGRGESARVADCLRSAGYTASVVHDDGRVSAAGQDPDVSLLLGDSDGMIKVREPSDTITVSDAGGNTVASITVSAGTLRYSADEYAGTAKAAVAACVAAYVGDD